MTTMFSCEICDIVFKSGASLSSHKYRFHKPTKSCKSTLDERYEKSDTQFSCKICNKVFKSGASLSSHVYRCHKTTKTIKSKTNKSNLNEPRGERDDPYGLQRSVFRMIKHQQLIKMLSRALLDDVLPMTAMQVDQLMPHGDIVRVLADGTGEDIENIFEDESNEKILKNLFDVFSYSFNNIF